MMRRLALNGASILIAGDDEATQAELVGVELPVGIVVGASSGLVAVANGTQEVHAIANVLGAKELSRIEELAYHLIDGLLDAQSDGLVKSVLTSAYHEIAVGFLRVASAYDVLARGDVALALMDQPLALAFGAGEAESAAPMRWSGLRYMLRPIRRSMRLLRQLPSAFRVLANLTGRKALVVTCNDSGTGINLRPLKAILVELDALEVPTILLTEVDLVAGDPDIVARHVLTIDGDLPILPVRLASPSLQAVAAADRLPPTLLTALERSLATAWPKYVTRFKRVQRVLSIGARFFSIRAVASIPETLPVSVSAGLWAKDHRVSWFGHFGATIGRCPDHYFFPATEHLAYGSQLADHIVATGRDRTGIHVVGSPAFDAHLGRDRVADRQAVEADFPRLGGKRLIVVTSEAFADPETELVPILRAVTKVAGAHVVFKIHPDDNPAVMLQMVERAGVVGRIDMVHRYPLGQLLGASDLLVSVMSTVIIEAAVAGTPTLVCDFSDKSAVLDFVAEGLCLGCKDPADLQKHVTDMLYDPEVIELALTKMRESIERFNGPNDGQSARRIARLIAARVRADVPTNGQSS